MVEDVLLESTFPQLLPAGASDGPPPLVLWPTQTPSREEESRSTYEDERLLTKRCIERQWKNTLLEQNTCLGVEWLP